MKLLNRLLSALVLIALAAGVSFGAWWLITTKPTPAKPQKPPPAARVAKPVKEEQLDTIVLTTEAEDRLGLNIETVKNKEVRRARLYGGEVTIPIGQAVIVVAPLGGTLKAPAEGVPKVGQPVKKGQPIFLFLPLLTPEARASLASIQVDADVQIKNAHVQFDAAQIALDRARRLLRGEAGSQRNVDEAQAAFDIASRALEAARARRSLLTRLVGEVEDGTGAPIRIDAPETGLLRNLNALAGQTVPTGANLFEVVNLERVWIRVPLPVGDLADVARTEEARVGSLTGAAGSKSHAARPALAPPSANPLAATVDIFYEVPNLHGQFIPGQRVGMTLPLADKKQSLTVPWSAIVHDIHGGTWVYERAAARTYVRRRVVVRHVAGTDAVLAAGPAAGTRIVTEGSQELFGAETGFSK